MKSVVGCQPSKKMKFKRTINTLTQVVFEVEAESLEQAKEVAIPDDATETVLDTTDRVSVVH